MRRLAGLFALACLACGSADSEPPPVAPTTCAPLELALPDGTCVRPGIGPNECGPGFAHDGEYGCDAILPSAPCMPGLMAVPGETECRPVMPCGRGKWGDIPIDATTVYVDQSYTAGDGDGSATKPWPTLNAAIIAAAPGALIAVAEGSYLEDVRITGKTLRIWGSCPEKVELVGTGAETAALLITTVAHGSEVHGISIRGPAYGVAVSGSTDVVLDRLWVHHTGSRGIAVQPNYGTTSVSVVSSLIEECHDAGIRISGSEGRVEGSVVRGTLPRSSDQKFGRGISVQLACDDAGVCDPMARSRGTITGSLVEQNHAFGIFVGGSDAHIEGTLVRGTLPDASDQRFGSGIVVQLSCTLGVCDPNTRSSATVKASVIEQNHEIGLMLGGSDGIVESTVIRGTMPRASDQRNGRGINIQDCGETEGCTPVARATATVLRSLVEDNHDLGIGVFGSDVTVDGSVVRETFPRGEDQLAGRGITAQMACTDQLVCDPDAPANVLVQGSLVDANSDVGVYISSSTATVRSNVVRGTTARTVDGLFGDGIAVFNAEATLENLHIEGSDRAGVSNFGGFASLDQLVIQCSGLDLAGEASNGGAFAFEDRGRNRCGCPLAEGACVALSPGLAPPEPFGSSE